MEIDTNFFIILQRSNVDMRILKILYGMCGADLALAPFWIFSDSWSCRGYALSPLYWGQMKSTAWLKGVCLKDWEHWDCLPFKKKCSGRRDDSLWGVGSRRELLKPLENLWVWCIILYFWNKNWVNFNKFQGNSQIFCAYLNSKSLHLLICSSS